MGDDRTASTEVGARPSMPALRGARGVAGVIAAALVIATLAAAPAVAEAAGLSSWQSRQFGLAVDLPAGWAVVDESSEPARGDVVILGNDVSALLLGLLYDTRAPRQLALDLVNSQKDAAPDLVVLQSSDTPAGSILVLMQYTIHPQSGAAIVVDEKALLGTLRADEATITIRGMVPDRADLDTQFAEIEGIISTLGVE